MLENYDKSFPGRRDLPVSMHFGRRDFRSQKTVLVIVGRGPFPRHARSPQRHREGQALAIQARTKKNARRTGPRATKPKTIAGDRPPRYGIQNRPSYRRARACPSPCCGLPENRGGQAPVLRYSVVCDRLIANGRATLNTPLLP